MTDFDTFWAAYPRREAKLNAMKAYDRARRIATAGDILAGVERYKAVMPDEKRFIPLPASFLNAGRWMDDYTPPVKRTVVDADWWDECARIHRGECGGDRMAHHVRKQIEKAS